MPELLQILFGLALCIAIPGFLQIGLTLLSERLGLWSKCDERKRNQLTSLLEEEFEKILLPSIKVEYSKEHSRRRKRRSITAFKEIYNTAFQKSIHVLLNIYNIDKRKNLHMHIKRELYFRLRRNLYKQITGEEYCVSISERLHLAGVSIKKKLIFFRDWEVLGIVTTLPFVLMIFPMVIYSEYNQVVNALRQETFWHSVVQANNEEKYQEYIHRYGAYRSPHPIYNLFLDLSDGYIMDAMSRVVKLRRNSIQSRIRYVGVMGGIPVEEFVTLICYRIDATDLDINININAEALGANYTRAGFEYTGAKLHGSVTVYSKVDSLKTSTITFQGYYSPPTSFRNVPKDTLAYKSLFKNHIMPALMRSLANAVDLESMAKLTSLPTEKTLYIVELDEGYNEHREHFDFRQDISRASMDAIALASKR